MDGAKLKTYVLPLLVRQSIKSLVPNLVGGMITFTKDH